MALAKKNLKVAVPPTEGDSVFVFGIVRQTILPQNFSRVDCESLTESETQHGTNQLNL